MSDTTNTDSIPKRIISLKDALDESGSTQIYLTNAQYTDDAASTLFGFKNPVIPFPVTARAVTKPTSRVIWNLTLVPGRVNVYTLQNTESQLYATIDENPDEGDVVVESTTRTWKISQGSQSIKGAPTYEITPTGPQENVLYWSQDAVPDSNPTLPTVAISLQKNTGTLNTAWLLFTV